MKQNDLLYHRPYSEDSTSSTGYVLDLQVVEHPMIRGGLDQLEVNQRAVLVAVGLVYYMRLNTDYRARFVKELDQVIYNYAVKFSKAFFDEVCAMYVIVNFQ